MFEFHSRSLGAAILCFALAGSALADDIPEKKRTLAGLYVTSAQAMDLLADPKVLLIDVRSRAEVAFLGIPTRANVHIPYMQAPTFPEYDPEKKTYGLEINPDFPSIFRQYAAEKGLATDTPIVLMCRSGSRSARAADIIHRMGYTQVYSLVDGFEGDKAADGPGKGQRVVNGWKNAGLAWSYEIEESQLYPDDRM